MNPSNVIPKFIFGSRWLQAPLYVGLVVVMAVYVYEFWHELLNLVIKISQFSENQIMLAALDLIDVVMIANLLIMVIVGGYETFVSHLNLQYHPDQPDWLSTVSAGSMKIKLSLALVGISSIHLLRTFIDPAQKSNYAVMWQILIHLTLVISALAIAVVHKFTSLGSHKP